MLSLFAPCPRGLEQLLAAELRTLRGVKQVRAARAGVAFAGDLEAAYRACLWSRLASRVLLNVADVPAATYEQLHASLRDLEWERHIGLGRTIAVDASGTTTVLKHTHFTALKTKDAIVDRLREVRGERPSVDVDAPDVLVNVLIRASRAVVSIDLSGQALHRRGYRPAGQTIEAPIKENLAAGVLVAAGWPEVAARGGAFSDPMCGSGTLAIEAALIAGDIAPGLARARWGFQGWAAHSATLWSALLEEAAERRAEGLRRLPAISASDIDDSAVEVARASVRTAGLAGFIRLSVSPVTEFAPPVGYDRGLVASNPPYGERISVPGGLPALYRDVGRTLKRGFAGWRVAFISADAGLASHIGLRSVEALDVYNGRIPSTIFVFETHAPRRFPPRPQPDEGTPHATRSDMGRTASRREESAREVVVPATTLSPESEQFANRLRKMARHFGTWARRNGVSCYRVYDADLPDYAVAIDVYQGTGPDEGRTWAHVAEYAPPSDVDPERARVRLAEVLAIVPDVLGVESSDVFLKVRERKRGSAQYERFSARGVVGIVGEDGLEFEVNFTDYLDTGLFLHHRLTRARVREMARGTRFCNLFAYTGTATVHAAAGGARSTTTVDMSATYLDWAARNMTRNGFDGPEHARVRSDVTAWLDAAADRGAEYDLVFCDPPTFSSSKRMEGTFDVQRDHVRLIRAASRLLAHGGTLLFSTNRRRFELDSAALDGLEVADITAATIPKDFECRARPHQCWEISRAGERRS